MPEFCFYLENSPAGDHLRSPPGSKWLLEVKSKGPGREKSAPRHLYVALKKAEIFLPVFIGIHGFDNLNGLCFRQVDELLPALRSNDFHFRTKDILLVPFPDHGHTLVAYVVANFSAFMRKFSGLKRLK
jgi:hypothetical protein